MKVPLIGAPVDITCYTRRESLFNPGAPYRFDQSSAGYYNWTDGGTHNAGTTYQINPDGTTCGVPFLCLATHVGSTATRPETGANWRTYWRKKTVGIPMPCAGVFSNLILGAYSFSTGGANVKATLLLNEGPTALTATVTDPASYAEDLANAVAVAAGERVALRQRGTLGSNITFVTRMGLLFEPTIAGLFPILGVHNAGSSGTEYFSILGGTGTDARVRCVVPVPGKFKNLYVDLNGLYAAGSTSVVTLLKNGVDTALTVTETGGGSYASQLVSDTTHEVSFAAGDFVSLKCVVSGGYPTFRWGVCFVPDDPRLWWIPRVQGYDAMINGTGYSAPALSASMAAGDFWLAGETALFIPGGCNITGIAAFLTNAPGAGKSRTFTLRRNWADTGVAVTLSDSEVFDVFKTGSIKPVNGQCFSVMATDDVGGSASSSGGFSLIGEGLPTGTPNACVPRSIPAIFIMS